MTTSNKNNDAPYRRTRGGRSARDRQKQQQQQQQSDHHPSAPAIPIADNQPPANATQDIQPSSHLNNSTMINRDHMPPPPAAEAASTSAPFSAVASVDNNAADSTVNNHVLCEEIQEEDQNHHPSTPQRSIRSGSTNHNTQSWSIMDAIHRSIRSSSIQNSVRSRDPPGSVAASDRSMDHQSLPDNFGIPSTVAIDLQSPPSMLNNHRRSQEQINQKLSRRIDSISAIMSNIRTEITTLGTEFHDLPISNMRDNISTLTTEFNHMRTDINTMCTDISNIYSDIDDIKAKLDSIVQANVTNQHHSSNVSTNSIINSTNSNSNPTRSVQWPTDPLSIQHKLWAAMNCSDFKLKDFITSVGTMKLYDDTLASVVNFYGQLVLATTAAHKQSLSMLPSAIHFTFITYYWYK